MAILSYLIQKNYLANLKVAAPSATQGSKLAVGVRKDWPEFVTILEKALKSIAEEERQKIRSKWVTIAATETQRDKLGLSVREQEWLSTHETMRLGIDTAWSPFEFLDEEGKHGQDGESDAGMELGVCYFVPDGKAMNFASARFDLYQFANGEVTIIKPTKSGIGYRGIPFEQKEAIYQALLDYQGDQNRRDDVSVIGFRV